MNRDFLINTIILLAIIFINATSITNINRWFNIEEKRSINYVVNDGEAYFANGSYEAIRTNDKTIQVSCSLQRIEADNPFSLSYDYNIIQKANGDFAMDLKGCLSPILFYIAPNYTIKETGTQVIFPKNSPKNTDLPEANGRIDIIHKDNKELLLSYKATIKNRKIKANQSLHINGQSFNAALHTYTLEINKVVKGTAKEEITIGTTKEAIKEWLVAGYGIVQQDRESVENIYSKETANPTITHQYQSTITSIE